MSSNDVICPLVPSCLFLFSIWDFLTPVSSLLFYLRMCHSHPVLHCHPNSRPSPSVLSQQSAPCTFLQPGPGFSHHPFFPFCCFHLHCVPQHQKCCLWHSPEVTTWRAAVAPPPAPFRCTLVFSQNQKELEAEGRGGRSAAEVACPWTHQGQGRRVLVLVVSPGKARLLAEGWEQLGKWCPLRASLATWSSSPVPGLKRTLGEPQSTTWSWCSTLLESKTCVLWLFLIWPKFSVFSGILTVSCFVLQRTPINYENTRTLIPILEAVPQAHNWKECLLFTFSATFYIVHESTK